MSQRPVPYFFWWLLIAAMFCALPLMAATPDIPLANASDESRARGLFNELRCVVCQGQSLSDSNATLAIQMRAHVRGMVAAGDSNQAILDQFAERYGVSVLLSPPMRGGGLWLWAMPLLLLLLGAWLLYRAQKRGRDA